MFSFPVMGHGHGQFFRSNVPRSAVKTAKASKRWGGGGWGGHGGFGGGHGGWGGHGGHGGWEGGHGYGEHHGFAAPYGHPITHPGFSTIGFPGHALATADVKNTIAQKRGRAKRQLLPAQFMAPPAYAPVAPLALHAPVYAPAFVHAPLAPVAPFGYPAAVPAAFPFAQGRK